MSDATKINTTCCISGCHEPAVGYADEDGARVVPYCSRHMSSHRATTKAYMDSIGDGAIASGTARGDRLRAEHHTHMKPAYGCPACPLDSRFVRDSAEGEWYVPSGG